MKDEGPSAARSAAKDYVDQERRLAEAHRALRQVVLTDAKHARPPRKRRAGIRSTRFRIDVCAIASDPAVAAARPKHPRGQQYRGDLRPRHPRAEGRVARRAAQGGIVALLGANGAGKTTTLKAISNLLHAERGEVTKGSIVFDGEEVHDAVAERTGAARLHPGDGRPALLRPSHHRGKSAHRRLHAPRRQAPRSSATWSSSTTISRASRTRRNSHGRLHLRRRAADVRDRPRADVAAEDDPARRAVDGARAADRRRNFRDRARSEREGRRLLPARRAEHQHGAEIRAATATSWRTAAS